jgi:hypothetical protein
MGRGGMAYLGIGMDGMAWHGNMDCTKTMNLIFGLNNMTT